MNAPHGEAELRAAICTVCRRLWERGLVAGQDGNVSARLGADRIVITPAGFSKVELSAVDLVVVTTGGESVSGTHKASSEMGLHLRAYERRPDVAAIVHAHPPTATGLGVAGETLPDDILPEISVLLGRVPLVRYAAPGTPELADRFESYWAEHDVFLMANHGALSLGPSLRAAHQRMESLEHAAQILASARTFGRVHGLAPDQLSVLRAERQRRQTNE